MLAIYRERIAKNGEETMMAAAAWGAGEAGPDLSGLFKCAEDLLNKMRKARWAASGAHGHGGPWGHKAPWEHKARAPKGPGPRGGGFGGPRGGWGPRPPGPPRPVRPGPGPQARRRRVAA